MSVAIIINPRSGGVSPSHARDRAEQAASTLNAAGVDGDVFVTERRGHAAEMAAAAVRRGVRLVIAWGGDGTVNEVGSALLSGPASLGIVPSGSGDATSNRND